MRCGYCGRKLIDAAVALGYCPSCGTPILRTNEVPVGAAHALGAAVPQLPPFPVIPDAPVQTPPTPTPPPLYRPQHDSSSPYRPVGEAPPPPPGVGGRMVDAVPPPPPQFSATVAQRRSGGGVIFTVLLLLVLVLGGGGYTLLRTGVIQLPAGSSTAGTSSSPVATATFNPAPTQTPRPTSTPLPTIPPPPAGFVRFFSLSGAFGLDYPASWAEVNQTSGANTTYSFTSADGIQYVGITESSKPITPRDIVSSLQSFVNGTVGSGDFGVTQDATLTTIGVNNWTSAQVAFTINNVTQDAIGYAANHGSEGIIIIYSAPTANFQTLSGSNFAQMVSTFTYLR